MRRNEIDNNALDQHHEQQRLDPGQAEFRRYVFVSMDGGDSWSYEGQRMLNFMYRDREIHEVLQLYGAGGSTMMWKKSADLDVGSPRWGAAYTEDRGDCG